ncbi:MAG: thiamine diphosphokinase [Zhaonellaceae bacterium]|jgi:thiamine pyrophosphokinase|nr:thiamine diphosphokinase [Clostridia bacterium]
MKCVIVAGGEKPQGNSLASLEQADLLICADSGANHVYELGYVPDLIIGDFDSIKPEILQAYCAKGCAIKTYPSEKDYTDTELAIQLALQEGVTQIDLLGAIGNRLDHSLANIFLLVTYQSENCQIRIVGSDCIAWVTKDKAVVLGDPGDFVSIISLTRVSQGVGLEGFKYPLCNASIFMGSTLGISNELLSTKGIISVNSGLLLIIHTKNSV